MSFRGRLTEAGRGALFAASNGELELGIAKVGSASLATNVIDDQVTDVVGTLQVTKAANQVFYTPFGSDRLVIFIDLRMDAELTIGNVVFFLADGTPFAWGAFDRQITKVGKGPDSGGDWITLALSIKYNSVLELFTFDNGQSTEYTMEVVADEEVGQATIAEWSRITMVFDKLTENLNIPAVAYSGNNWYVNPFFFPVDIDFSILSGGEVGDLYDRTPV